MKTLKALSIIALSLTTATANAGIDRINLIDTVTITAVTATTETNAQTQAQAECDRLEANAEYWKGAHKSLQHPDVVAPSKFRKQVKQMLTATQAKFYDECIQGDENHNKVGYTEK